MKYKIIDRKNDFDTLFKQILWINTLGKDLIYLHQIRDNSYHESIFSSDFFLRLIEGLKTMFALKFCIFLDNKGHCNIYSFINILITKYDSSDWENLITIHDLRNIEYGLIQIKSSNEFRTLKYMRDKFYAHEDNEKENKNLETDLIKVMIVVNKLIEYFRLLGSKLFGINYITDLWNMDHKLIESLSRYYEIMELINHTKYEKQETVISIIELEACINKY